MDGFFLVQYHLLCVNLKYVILHRCSWDIPYNKHWCCFAQVCPKTAVNTVLTWTALLCILVTSSFIKQIVLLSSLQLLSVLLITHQDCWLPLFFFFFFTRYSYSLYTICTGSFVLRHIILCQRVSLFLRRAAPHAHLFWDLAYAMNIHHPVLQCFANKSSLLFFTCLLRSLSQSWTVTGLLKPCPKHVNQTISLLLASLFHLKSFFNFLNY